MFFWDQHKTITSCYEKVTGNEAPQDALLSTESIEVRPLVPKGILSVRQSSRLRPLNLSPSQIRTCGFPAYGSS